MGKATKTIFRVEKNKDNPYVIINKSMVNDENLSWKAKGILSYLLSLPDDWVLYETEIAKHSSDGIDSLSSGIKELIEFGYISRERKRNEKGQLKGYEYVVSEVSAKSGLSKTGLSKIGLPKIGKSKTTNNDLTNNDLTNNNIGGNLQEDISEDKTITLPEHNDYKSVYDHYINLGLITHRTFTDDMRKAIKSAMTNNKYTIDYCKILLDRHKQMVEQTKDDGQYSIKPRSLEQFFGQKVFNAKHLICSEYDVGGEKYQKLNKVPTKKPIENKRGLNDYIENNDTMEDMEKMLKSYGVVAEY